MFRPDSNYAHHHRTVNGMAIVPEYQFTEFEKAFDSVDRRVLWTIFRQYGIPVKIIKIIQSFYQDMTCQVIHGTELTERLIWVMKNILKAPRGI